MKGKFLALLIGGAMMVAAGLTPGDAFAKPPGLRGDPEVGKQLWKFNVISLPPNSNWAANGNACNGARIFFQEDNGQTLGTLTWYLDPTANGFTITDCDGTDGAASVEVDENDGHFLVAIRVLGNSNNLHFVCNVINNPNVPAGEDLCVIDVGNFGHDKNFIKVMKNIAEGEFEEVLWTLSDDWKIFDVRVFEYIPQ